MDTTKFWSLVSKDPDGCWRWMGRRTPDGYGAVTYKGRTTTAHRVAMAITNGEFVPKGMDVCHSCDNRPCVNPSHLWVGSRGDNMKDARQKGRVKVPHPTGEDHPNAKLTNDQRASILAERGQGASYAALSIKYGVSAKTIRIHCNPAYKQEELDRVRQQRANGSGK